MLVSTWLKATDVTVSTEFGHWSLAVAAPPGRLVSKIAIPDELETANSGWERWCDTQVNASLLNHVARGSFVLLPVYGSHSFTLRSEALQERSLRSLFYRQLASQSDYQSDSHLHTHANPFINPVCPGTCHTSSRPGKSQTFRTPSPEPLASLSRASGSISILYTPST